MGKFTHLHVHTQYSILDGLASIPKLIEKAYNDGMPGIAITDHGNMFGVFSFVSEVEKFNKKIEDPALHFKSIIGCEVYVAAKSRFSKKDKEDRSGRHLILLAKNMTGYRNLSRLVSLAFVDGFYYTPRIDKEILRKYSEGIIACSACLGGEVPQAILKHNPDPKAEVFDLEEAGKVIEEFKSIFGEDYYLEMQKNGHREQELVNRALIELAKKHNVKCIATNDAHYVDKEDFEAHKVLICINTRKDYYSQDGAVQDEDSDNGLAYSGQEYLRTTQEMEELFADYPEAITNTQEIVDKIEKISLRATPNLPKFEVPEEFEDEYAYLEHLTYEGAARRWPEITDEIKERLDFELSTVKRMGFPGYFLIVWDFINEGKKMGVRFGPGRGSAAGSAVAYCLNITNIDPIKYGLLFERFLNPDRISLPDMDIDIDDSGREKVLDYVIDKYGKDRVAQIVTFNTMAAKSAIRDCARVLKLPLNESDRLAKLVPEGPKVTLKKAFDEIPELRSELQSNDPLTRSTLSFAQQLEGTVRNSGVHACGVIIGREDLIDQIPLSTQKNTETLVTQYEGSLVEDAGLLKMDFLGLKTLNIIESTLYNIKKRHDLDLDIDLIPLDDSPTLELFCKGDTTGIFQFESPGMRKYLQELKPQRFEDIIAMVSLYRPGPMDNIPNFINRKSGTEKIVYPIPEMKEYLDETYGITVYQEQVMLLSQLLANFTKGQADSLRKAMGKKQEKVMNELEENFMQGGIANNHDPAVLQNIWKEWKKFAEYAFNKSHATCYAFIAYQTAYLKAHYPAEFMAANLTNNLDNIDKISFLIDDTNRMQIQVLRPDINESDNSFIVNKAGDIRFGLGALKGVGSAAVSSLIEEREKNGPFTNIFDFISRINLRNCNKRCIESMAYAGAFDSFENIHRAQFFNEDKEGRTFTEKLVNYGTKIQTNSSQNQTSIFDDTPEMEELKYPDIPICEPWHTLKQLEYEREVAGFYISGHPLDNYKAILQNYANVTLSDIQNSANLQKYTGRVLCFAGIITSSQSGKTKTNKDFGKIILEDYGGSFQWMMFGEDFTKYRHLFDVGNQIFVKAKVTERFRGKDYDGEKSFDIKPMEIFYLDDAYKKLCSSVKLTINIRDISPNLAHIIKETINKSSGKTSLNFCIQSHNNGFYSDFNSFESRINPQLFIQNLKLPVDYKLELK